LPDKIVYPTKKVKQHIATANDHFFQTGAYLI